MQKLKEKMAWDYKGRQLDEVLRWIKNAKISKMRKTVLHSFLAACIYHIWRVRNDALWAEKRWNVDNTVHRIAQDFKLRLNIVMPKKAAKVDREWVAYLCTK